VCEREYEDEQRVEVEDDAGPGLLVQPLLTLLQFFLAPISGQSRMEEINNNKKIMVRVIIINSEKQEIKQ
jgi:hypothetical protein